MRIPTPGEGRQVGVHSVPARRDGHEVSALPGATGHVLWRVPAGATWRQNHGWRRLAPVTLAYDPRTSAATEVAGRVTDDTFKRGDRSAGRAARQTPTDAASSAVLRPQNCPTAPP